MSKKIAFRNDKNIFYFSYGKSKNEKLTDMGKIVRVYTFSIEQYQIAQGKLKMQEFYKLDESNCLDCPLSANQREKGKFLLDKDGKKVSCYTQKFNQYRGFLSILRNLKIENIPYFSDEVEQKIVNMVFSRFVRVGDYGEPSLLPITVLEKIHIFSKAYTGYTHQYAKSWAAEYSKYLRASAHNTTVSGWKSFILVTDKEEYDKLDAIPCPASKEMNYKSNCEKCSLCSGTEGKGKKVDVKIFDHG